MEDQPQEPKFAKRKRRETPATSPNARGQRGNPQYSGDWPPKAPLLLTTGQSDKLGEYMNDHVQMLRNEGFGALVDKLRGPSDISHDVRELPHKVAPLLDHYWKRGAAICGLRRSAGRSNPVSFPQGNQT
jgi:hypothetical protein